MIGSSWKVRAARTITSSGTAPLRIAAMFESTVSSAQVMSVNGMTMLMAAITARWP